jgi:MFS family permease
MAAGLIAPVLPRMSEVFRDQPHHQLLISLISTFPALFVAILAWPSGALGDRIGHKRLLMWATGFYAIFGMAPLFLSSLPQILFSRALVGVAESAVMTCSITLIGACFDRARRQKYLALQSGTAPVAALVFFAIGGSLGELNWRYPFSAYGFGLVLFLVIGLWVREPLGAVRASGFSPEANTTVPFKWTPLVAVCGLSVFAMSAFMITVIQLGFLLAQRGITSAAQIGFWLSVTSLANPIGALFTGLSRSSLMSKLCISFILMGAGFIAIVIAPGWQGVVVGAVIANLGAGMVLSALSFSAVQVVPPAKRGMGIGIWTSSMFTGQFVGPIAVLGLTQLTGTLVNAVLAYGVLSLLVAAALIGGYRYIFTQSTGA